MKHNIFEFIRRGLSACGLGPIVLAILYLILRKQGVIDTLSVDQVCLGIFSLSTLAFVAGGMNVIYQIERLPLMVAIFIHGAVLYLSYLATYLVNGWLAWGKLQILVFSGIFILGYLVIWAVIYSIVRKSTRQLNEHLKQKQQIAEYQ